MNAKPPAFRLPPDATRREQEWADQMRLWLSDSLDEQHAQSVDEANAMTAEEWAIAVARAGRPELLRQLYPQFADCIFSPQLGRGKKYPKQRRLDEAKLAADFAQRIRALWRKHCKKVRRRPGEKTAEDFAIRIIKDWTGETVTVDEVLDAAKPSGKRKTRAK